MNRSLRAFVVVVAAVSSAAAMAACGEEEAPIIGGTAKRGKGGSAGSGGSGAGGKGGAAGKGGASGATGGGGSAAGSSGAGPAGTAGTSGGAGAAGTSAGSAGKAGSGGAGTGGASGTAGAAGTGGFAGMVPTATTTMEPPKPPPLKLAKSDVAILYPLPTKLSEMSQLIAPTAGIGDGSVLLPPALFTAAISALDLKKGVNPFGVPKAPALTSESYSSLRLVAVRLVPCGPPLSLVDAPCQSVVRLTLQPVIPAPDGSGFVALNGSVQIIFAVPLPELVVLAKEIGALVIASKGYVEGPLGIHPLLVREGYVGAFGEGLRKAVLGKLTSNKLKRIAVLTNLSDDGQPPPATGAIQFRFAAVGIDGGFVRITNHEAASPYQGVYASTAGKGTGVGGLGNTPVGGPGDPRTYGPAGYSSSTAETECLVKQLAGYELGGPAPSAGAPDIGDDSGGKATALQKQAYRSSLRLESPTLHQTNTTDCTSCHLAGAFRARSEGEGLSLGTFPSIFTSSRPLDRASPKTISIQNFHAFAYAGVDLSVSQRVTNEAAVDADALEKAANTP